MIDWDGRPAEEDRSSWHWVADQYGEPLVVMWDCLNDWWVLSGSADPVLSNSAKDRWIYVSQIVPPTAFAP